jgi:hypothetical protein
MSCSLWRRLGDSAGSLVVWEVLSAFSDFSESSRRSFFSLSSLLILLRACFSIISDSSLLSSWIYRLRYYFTRLNFCTV